MVSRFFAYGDGLDEYADDVSRFVFRYIKKMNEEFRVKPLLIDAYKQRFYETMEFINNNFPIGFRKTEKATTTPRSRYEAIAIGTYHFWRNTQNLKLERILILSGLAVTSLMLKCVLMERMLRRNC